MLKIIPEGHAALLGDLRRMARDAPIQLKAANTRVGQIVRRKAVNYCPISPTKAQHEAGISRATAGRRRSEPDQTRISYGAGGGVLIGSSTRKSKRSDFNPGVLRKSISIMKVTAGYVDIGVPLNAGGGKYAHYIHDQRYSEWKNRGIGTRRAGPQAKEKFIERAIVDSHGDIYRIYDDAARKFLRTR